MLQEHITEEYQILLWYLLILLKAGIAIGVKIVLILFQAIQDKYFLGSISIHPIFNFNLPSLHNGGTRRGSDEYGLQVCQNHHQVTSGHSRLTIGRIKSPFWFMHLYLKIWFTFFENQDFIFFDDVIFIWNFSSNAESFNWIKTNQTNNSLIPHLCLELLLSCL